MCAAILLLLPSWQQLCSQLLLFCTLPSVGLDFFFLSQKSCVLAPLALANSSMMINNFCAGAQKLLIIIELFASAKGASLLYRTVCERQRRELYRTVCERQRRELSRTVCERQRHACFIKLFAIAKGASFIKLFAIAKGASLLHMDGSGRESGACGCKES